MAISEYPEFTHKGYVELLDLLRNGGYACASYTNWKDKERPVILRHDVDYDVRAALKLAEVEKDRGANSTYFFLIRNGLYNCLSVENVAMIKEIAGLGHDIGLHFDEKVYPQERDMAAVIHREANVLSQVLELPIESVSMHRPSKVCLEESWDIPGLVNSYDQIYCGQIFKYLSDSHRHWREPVLSIVRSGEYGCLHILTHAFWYTEGPKRLADTLNEYIASASDERQMLLADNFTDLEGALSGSGEA